MRAMGSWIVLTVLFSAGAVAQENLSARERVMACDPAVAIAAAREILNDPRSLREPAEMFTPALVLFQGGKKDEALFWFYAAQLRARYQLVFQQGERGQPLQVLTATVGAPINNYGFSDTANMRRTLDRVLEWDAKTANPQRDKSQAPEQSAHVAQVYAGYRQLRDKLVAEGPSLEREAKQSAYLQSMQNPERAVRCAPGQVDPSLVERETRSEEARVVELVKSDPGVVAAAGALKAVSVHQSVVPDGSSMPSHYTVSARGDRTIFAEVDVTRSGRDARLTLRCTTSVSPGQRNPREDPCAK